jgi:hypothetical protein
MLVSLHFGGEIYISVYDEDIAKGRNYLGELTVDWRMILK